MLNGFTAPDDSSNQTRLSISFINLAARLQDSFAVGDFNGHSDVDFIAALEGELSDAQVPALQAMQEHIYTLGCA